MLQKKVISDKNKEKSETYKKGWASFKDLLIHNGLFKKGIIAVTPKHMPHYGVEENNSFHFKDRQFFFQSLKINNATTNAVPHSGYLSQAKTLLSKLNQLVVFEPSANEFNHGIVLSNKRHKEEIFLPFTFTDKKQQQIGTYLYPWLTQYDANIELSGFNSYHTAGCLFGSALKGVDQYGSIFELIKHKIEFFPGQKIHHIMHNPDEPNPYELMLFKEFKKIACLINTFSKPNQSKRLVYHLPYFDYVLFGIELFISDRITFEALGDLFKEIFAKKTEHIGKIKKICDIYEIDVIIESPFGNIFGSLDDDTNITKTILGKLKLSPDQPNVTERELVKHCLFELKSNLFKVHHSQVWKDFFDLNGDNINDIEGLLKAGNAVMLGVASLGEGDYKTCSFLPLSEKQIQIEYKKYHEQYLKKNLDNSVKYPKIFNITTLDPLIAYSPITKSLPTKDLAFYFNLCSGTLSDLITKKQIITYACKNVGLFVNKRKRYESLQLEKLLTKKSQIQQLPFSTIKINFEQYEEAKLFEDLIRKRYEEHKLSNKSIVMHKFKLKDPDNNNIADATYYAVKLASNDFEKIFPNYIITDNQISIKQNSVQALPEESLQVDQVLTLQCNDSKSNLATK